MDLQNMTLFKMADERMKWLAQRQSVIAKNIANADTPDYMPSDLVKQDFRKELQSTTGVAMAVTNPMHRTNSSKDVVQTTTNPAHLASRQASGVGKEKVEKRTYETSIDKNGVVLEEQMIKADENRSAYDAATTIFKKNMSMLTTALGKGK